MLYSKKSAEFYVATCIDGSAAPEKRNYSVLRAGKLAKGTRQVIHTTVFVL